MAFAQLTDRVIVENISPETYCKKYLNHLLQHRKYYLSIYADVLEKLMFHTKKKQSEVVFIDIGSGNGMLALFAKFCGFKKVFINDIDGKFIVAAQNLSLQMEIPIDGFICGDIHAVKLSLKGEMPDAVAGTDVIEHIYDLHVFFKTLLQINPGMITIFTTASNPKNYFKLRKLKQLQLRDEYKGGTPEDFILFGDSPLEPFFKIRQEIIRSQFSEISDESLFKLVKATRGMQTHDILASVKKYKLDRTIPIGLSHPTNTCNPLTGSWTERILPIKEYELIYDLNSMCLKVYNGFYDEYKKGLKKILNKFLNKMVLMFGIYFSPYIIFAGSKK